MNETLKNKVARLFEQTQHEVLWGISSTGEFFTSENLALLATKNNEVPIKFERSELKKTEFKDDLNGIETTVKTNKKTKKP